MGEHVGPSLVHAQGTRHVHENELTKIYHNMKTSVTTFLYMNIIQNYTGRSPYFDMFSYCVFVEFVFL